MREEFFIEADQSGEIVMPGRVLPEGTTLDDLLSPPTPKEQAEYSEGLRQIDEATLVNPRGLASF